MRLSQRIRVLPWLLFAVVGGGAGSAPILAADTGLHTYYIDEPVFGGQAYIAEAGQRGKPTLVLVHGLNDSMELWRPFIPALARHFHVISFDLPGFGRSTKANKLYSPENYVAFIRHVLERYAQPQIRLVGHSLGANIALHYAGTYPAQVERLALVSVAGVLHRLAYTQFLTHFGIRQLPEFYGGQGRELKGLADRVLGVLADNAALIELGEQYMLSQAPWREHVLGGHPSAIAAHAMMLSDVTESLSRQSVPTLLIWGAEDRVTPLRTGKLLAATLANAGLAVIEGAAHVPLRDRRQQFAQLLLPYLVSAAAERDALLAGHRYQRASSQGANAERVGRCQHERDKVFHGTYKLIVIEHCTNIRLEQVVADRVSILHSDVTIEASVIESTGTALSLEASEVIATATQVQGQPALRLLDSSLDMAGGRLRSAGDAVLSMAGPQTPSSTTTGSRILFSVSRLDSKHSQRYLHGPVLLSAGQGL
ncbi:MAG: alpha/beta hydrolase [Gammaproteobacteria bacterium]